MDPTSNNLAEDVGAEIHLLYPTLKNKLPCIGMRYFHILRQAPVQE